METDDLKFLIRNLANLCGIPTRLYKDKELISFNSFATFPKDPFILHQKEILNMKESIGYYTTSNFFYYGFINYQEYNIIIGPFRPIKPTKELLTKMALELELPKEEYQNFIFVMSSIINMPLESVLQALSMFNFILNKEKKSLTDILLNFNSETDTSNSLKNDLNISAVNTNEGHNNNSFSIEQDLSKIVENGEIDKLKSWLKSAPSTRSGLLSYDIVRQAKNTFIVSTTVFSRAAINGGMDVKEALSLSDLYIQKAELLNNINDITSLQIKMILDYTEHVAKIRGKENASPFLIKLNKYIISHYSDPIKSDEICSVLYISKSSLFEKIKKETNMTLSEYILNMKINEATYLLKHTNKSIAAISVYLGFSSQSHFNNTFKKFNNTTPIKYRIANKHHT